MVVKGLAATFLILAVLFSFSPAHASPLPLVPNGGDLIYDPNLHVTWYDPVPTAMSWTYATTVWAPGLTVGGTTAGSWSLPTTPGTTFGYTSEGQMGYLYYTELGNAVGGPLTKTGPFTNLMSDRYWTGTETGPSTGIAWDFHFDDGLQDTEYEFINYYALAVHSGDVGAPVPIPGAIFLFAPGLAGIAALKRRTGRRG